jgi:hypothetical protein
VQLRLVLPLLGREMREALATLPPEEPLRLYMVAEEDGRQLNLQVRMGPDSSQALAAMVEDDNEDSAFTLGALLELSRDVACWTMSDPDGRQWPPLSPDVVVMTVLPPSLVRPLSSRPWYTRWCIDSEGRPPCRPFCLSRRYTSRADRMGRAAKTSPRISELGGRRDAGRAGVPMSCIATNLCHWRSPSGGPDGTTSTRARA